MQRSGTNGGCWMHERWSCSCELRIRCNFLNTTVNRPTVWMRFKFEQTRERAMATTSNRIFRFWVNRQWLKWNYNSIELDLIYDRNVMGKYEHWTIMCVWQRESTPSNRIALEIENSHYANCKSWIKYKREPNGWQQPLCWWIITFSTRFNLMLLRILWTGKCYLLWVWHVWLETRIGPVSLRSYHES